MSAGTGSSRETREERQLRLIGELVAELSAASISWWLRGGWAMDFFLGRVTRPHDDIDLFAWRADSERLVEILVAAGFEEVGEPRPAAQRNLAEDDELVHVVLLERTPEGSMITPPGRWAAHLGGPESDDGPEEWPADMLEAPPGCLGALVAPIVDPAAQLEAIEAAARLPGHPLSEKHRLDREQLRDALAAVRPK